MRLGLVILLTFSLTSVFAQLKFSSPLFKEVRLTVDNDVLTFNMHLDQYYSSGIYPSFRFLARTNEKLKLIRTFYLNHRIYTPKKVSWNQQWMMDRPYAGQISASASNEYYFHSGSYLRVRLELGWMGPHTGTEALQIKWHEALKTFRPNGWKFQINDSPILNTYINFSKPLFQSKTINLLMESSGVFGSTFNFIREEMKLQLGKLSPIRSSALYGASLGENKTLRSDHKLSEAFLIYGFGMEYVIYNATIEGNLIGKKSPYTEQAIPWIWQHEAGVMFSWPRFDFSWTLIARRNETPEATNHFYARVNLTQRF